MAAFLAQCGRLPSVGRSRTSICAHPQQTQNVPFRGAHSAVIRRGEPLRMTAPQGGDGSAWQRVQYVLDKVTQCFPLWVIGGAVLALKRPASIA